MMMNIIIFLGLLKSVHVNESVCECVFMSKLSFIWAQKLELRFKRRKDKWIKVKIVTWELREQNSVDSTKSALDDA